MSDNSDNVAIQEAKGGNPSLEAFYTAIVFNGVVGIAVVLLFSLLRKHFKNVYAPRTYIPDEKHRSPPLGDGLFSWISPLMSVKEEQVARKIGLDSYLFLRYFSIAARLFLVFTVFSCAILIPLNLVGQSGPTPAPGTPANDTTPILGLDTLTIGHVTDENRLWAHLILLYAFVGLTIWTLYRELLNFITLRHAFLVSPDHRRTRAAFSILLTEVPESLRREAELSSVLSAFGSVSSLTLAWSDSKVQDLHKDLTEHTLALENAEVALLRDGTRPLMKPGKIPGLSANVDAIEYLRGRIEELAKDLAKERTRVLDSPANVGAAFATFEDQRSVHVAAQALIGSAPLRMSRAYPDVDAQDVIWANLRIPGFERWGRTLAVWILTILLILTWSVIVTAVTAIANLDALIEKWHWLSWINDIPAVVRGIIKGVFPAVVMAIVLSLPPTLVSLLTSLQGIPLQSRSSISTQHKYFTFLVINVLLIVTFAGGFIQTINLFSQGFSVVILSLARELPTASNFFISYVLLLAFSTATRTLLAAPVIIVKWIFLRFLAPSPRKVSAVLSMPSLNWGIDFPSQVIIFCIGFSYCVIQPIILPFIFLYFALFGIVFRYRLLYVLDQDPHTSLHGRAFPVAVSHTIVGVFIAELFMFGLFLLRGKVALTVLSGILILLTGIANKYLNGAFKKLNRYLPAESSEGMQRKAAAVYASTPLSGSRTSLPAALEDGPDADESAWPSAVMPSRLHLGDISRLGPIPGATSSPDWAQDHYLAPELHSAPPVVWLPRDVDGKADAEVTSLRAAGIPSTTEGATLTLEGRKIHIDVVPGFNPDEVTDGVSEGILPPQPEAVAGIRSLDQGEKE